MTAALALGQTPITLSVTVPQQSICSFALEFWTDDTLTVHADLTGVTVRIAAAAAAVSWDATVAAGVATWDLDATDTDLDVGHYDARLLLIQSGASFTAATGDLVVAS